MISQKKHQRGFVLIGALGVALGKLIELAKGMNWTSTALVSCIQARAVFRRPCASLLYI